MVTITGPAAPRPASPEPDAAQRLAGHAALLAALGMAALAGTMAWHLTIASLFGTSSELDAYWIGLAIPKAIVDSIHFGILTFVFILMWRTAAGSRERWAFASACVNAVFLLTVAAAGVLVAAAPVLAVAMAPGLAPQDQALAADMLQWLSVMMLPSAVAGAMAGLLNAHQLFGPFGVARVTAPLSQCVLLVMLAPRLQARALIWATLGGAVATMLVLVPQIRRVPFEWVPTLRLGAHSDRRPLALFLALAGFSILERANQMSDRLFASLLGPGSVSVLEFAWRFETPVSQVLSFAVALPTFVLLVACIEGGRPAEMRATVLAGLRLAALCVAPVVGFITILREPITEFWFLRGAFAEESSAMVASLIPVLAAIFLLRSFGSVMVGGFLALGRTRRLLLVLTAEVAANTALNAIFAQVWGLWGIAFATALAMAAGNAYLWHRFLDAMSFESRWAIIRELARPLAVTATSLAVLGAGYGLVRNVPGADPSHWATLIGLGLLFGAAHVAAARAAGEIDIARRGRGLHVRLAPARCHPGASTNRPAVPGVQV